MLVLLVHIDGFLTFPTSFNSAAKWVQCLKVTESIRGQSDRDCCCAIARAEAASDRVAFLMSFSAQDVYFCASSDEYTTETQISSWSSRMTLVDLEPGTMDHVRARSSGRLLGFWPVLPKLQSREEVYPRDETPFDVTLNLGAANADEIVTLASFTSIIKVVFAQMFGIDFSMITDSFVEVTSTSAVLIAFSATGSTLSMSTISGSSQLK